MFCYSEARNNVSSVVQRAARFSMLGRKSACDKHLPYSVCDSNPRLLGLFHQLGNTNNFRIKRKEEITCFRSKPVFSNALVSSSILKVGDVQSLLL